jgi:tetratricopeptide (TPR) repeat protein
VVLVWALILTFFFPVLRFPFVNWDDPRTVLENPHILSLDGASLRWMFTHFYEGFFTPLTMLSLSWDHRVGGLDPGVYHRTNLFLHMLNALWVFLLSRRILERAGEAAYRGLGGFSAPVLAAFLTCLLFALHPLHVEPVAWVTGRKDLLCAFFYLSSLWMYLDHAEAVATGGRRYVASLALFAASLLSKPMAVSLPFVLLLLDAWPLRRLSTDLRHVLGEKVPFFAMAAAAGTVAILSEAELGAMAGLADVPLDLRIMNAFHSIAFYLGKTLWPTGLSALYPLAGAKPFSAVHVLSALSVLAVTLVLFAARRRLPGFAAAWAFYLATLAPVLGVVQVGGHAAADRYTYLPLWGPFLVLSHGAVLLLGFRRKTALVVLLASLAVMTARTRVQVGLWGDSVTLWENAVRTGSDVSAIADSNLGDAYRERGRWSEAIRSYERSIELDPGRVNPYNGMASAYFLLGRTGEAERLLRRAVVVDPKSALAHYNLGYVLAQEGRTEPAIAETREALRIDPGFAQAYNNLGVLLGRSGREGEARDAFRMAVALDPDRQDYRRNLEACEKRVRPPDGP